MRKKWIAGLLAISMIAAMGGCSGAGTSSSSQKAKESSAGESSVAEESSETEENQSENSSEAEKNADTANQSKVLFEDSTARITYTGTDEESWMGKGLKVTIENLSDKNITVQTRETSVNGVMDDPYFSCDVASGKQQMTQSIFPARTTWERLNFPSTSSTVTHTTRLPTPKKSLWLSMTASPAKRQRLTRSMNRMA